MDDLLEHIYAGEIPAPVCGVCGQDMVYLQDGCSDSPDVREGFWICTHEDEGAGPIEPPK
jgi:hypothetical protein